MQVEVVRDHGSSTNMRCKCGTDEAPGTYHPRNLSKVHAAEVHSTDRTAPDNAGPSVMVTTIGCRRRWP